MAHYLTNNEKFHIFSKSPVLSSMAVSQAVNKSGHTVSTNDVWADDVPWFTEVADEAGAITRAADARYNDLILWGSDIYVRKGDKTNGASTGTTFAELWEKHTELTEARAYALSSVTTQTPTNIVTKTVEIKNASDKVVLKYHVGKQIDLLTTANNANVASTWAARMFIDGKVVDQFVSPTDKVFAGNPSTGYTTLVYTATAAGNKYGFVAEGEADADFVNNAFAGIVQFNQSRNSGHKFAASVFEYVGDKLDTTLGNIREEIQDIVGVTMEGVVASVGTNDAAASAGIGVDSTSKTSPKITFTAGSVETNETKLVTGGAVAAAIAQAKSEAIASAEVTITAGTGIVVTGEGKGTTFQIAVSDDVATAAALSALSQTVASNKTELEGKITSTESAIKGQSLAQTGTLSGMFTVATDGSVGTGITGITITDAGLAQAISDAKQAGTDAASAVGNLSSTSVNYSTSLGSDADAVTVALGGTVGAPEVKITNVAAASALTALETKVNNFHKAGVSYKVYTATPLPDLSIEDNVKEYKNVILLVPKNPEGEYTPPSAISGDYTEYLCVNKGTEEAPQWTWEQIGTTAADLTDYVKVITVNGKNLTNNNDGDSNQSYLELGSFASTVASGQATTLANQGSVYADIRTDGSLTLGVASATDSVMGVSKMFSGNYWELPSSATDTAVSTLTASQMFNGIGEKLATKADANNVVNTVNGLKGAVNICVHNNPEAIGGGDVSEGTAATNSVSTCANLWGMGVMSGQEVHGNNTVTIIDTFVGMSKSSSYLTTASLPSTAVSVENNFVMNANGVVITTIRPERMVTGFSAQSASGLKSFVGDLSNLTSAACGSAESTKTFYLATALDTFIGDLSSLTDGNGMFCHCYNLTTFISDLSSLTDGYEMFGMTNLSLESVECIADTINDLADDTRDENNQNWGVIGIYWSTLPAESERQALVDELSRIVDKGWTLRTNQELHSLFDSEKYQVVQGNIQPLDLDSEPQTVYYVVKK